MEHYILRTTLKDKEVDLRPTDVQHNFESLEQAQNKAKEISQKYPEATFKAFKITELEL